MGYLLKEALKTLCGVNQWSYAVFWKFGCQNPKLLIWEECYYGPTSCLGLPEISGNGNSKFAFQDYKNSLVPPVDKVRLLVNKMMMDDHVKIVGEGLVGRVVFTGSHQWILAENYYKETYPPEVLKDLCQQFAAGMQTVAVIPVLPYGVLQFGSSLTIVENMGFINDVVSLVLQLGAIPGALQSKTIDSQTSYSLTGEITNDLQFMDGVAKAEVIPSNSTSGANQYYSLQIPSSMNASSSSTFSHHMDDTVYGDACMQTQSGDDLFDILGADFKNKLLGTCKTGAASSGVLSTSQENTASDHLLDAMVSTVRPPALDDSSCKTTLSNMSCNSSVSTTASLPYGRLGISKGDLLKIPKYPAKGEPMSCSSGTTYSKGSSIYDSWVGKGKNVNSNKPHEATNKANRKRLKPGENPRPRPKDRQMIQDRVKELREIVPNGTKCSIDALLECTIKHMLFLQSVTKHADKLKQTANSKIISKDDSLLLKDNIGGATWAYEVGSQSLVCPIIVEDLNQPNQMLVEMLCKETGLFLEIADTIRGLGLTILKGVMETRNDKIWAHFTVEANRDVTRMNVFLSLFRLLERNDKTSETKPNSVSNNGFMVQEFQQAGFGKQITSMV